MTPVALLLVCVFAAYAIQSSSGGTAPVAAAPMPPAPLFESSKIYNGVVGVTYLGDTSSCPPRPYSKADAASREKTLKVPFDQTFFKPPGVTFTITWFDADQNSKLRYNVEITEVTTTDFTITFKTWCNSFVYSMKVTYWVFGASTGRASSAST